MNEMKLWYVRSAEKWEESLPIGNGSLGAMIKGGTDEEILGLNEESLWSVSYTHLDVYKRQVKDIGCKAWNNNNAS